MKPKATRVRAQRLARARLFVATDWKWTDMSWLAGDATLDWAFFFEAGAYEVAASLALDGMPASWPRGVSRDGKGRAR